MELERNAWSFETATLPTPLEDPAMAFFGGTMLLFGGYSQNDIDSSTLDSTLTWDGTGWYQHNLPTSPSKRSSAMAATTGSGILLFGGVDMSSSMWSYLGDTWLWDGSQWTEVHPATSPSPRSDAVAAAVGNTVILFGGFDFDSGYLGDTWIWDGQNWTQKNVPGPEPRGDAVMTTLAGQVVLFGGGTGMPGQNVTLEDTWVWDGAGWTERMTKGPSPRTRAGMATLDGKAVLFGGEDANGDDLSDTWTWDGTSWTELHVPGPTARSSVGMMTNGLVNTPQ